jgi:hypothetical protein
MRELVVVDVGEGGRQRRMLVALAQPPRTSTSTVGAGRQRRPQDDPTLAVGHSTVVS